MEGCRGNGDTFSEGMKQRESHGNGTKAITTCVPLRSRVKFPFYSGRRADFCPSFPSSGSPLPTRQYPELLNLASPSLPSGPQPTFTSLFPNTIPRGLTILASCGDQMHRLQSWHTRFLIWTLSLSKLCNFGQSVQSPRLRLHILKATVFATN